MNLILVYKCWYDSVSLKGIYANVYTVLLPSLHLSFFTLIFYWFYCNLFVVSRPKLLRDRWQISLINYYYCVFNCFDSLALTNTYVVANVFFSIHFLENLLPFEQIPYFRNAEFTAFCCWENIFLVSKQKAEWILITLSEYSTLNMVILVTFI